MIINNKIYEDLTHSDCVEKYLEENSNSQLQPGDIDRRFMYDTTYDVPIACAHLDKESKAIFIELDSIQNMTLNEVIEILKNKYPDYSFYDEGKDNNISNDINNYNKIAIKRRYKMKRLIRKSDAIRLDSNVTLNAQDVMTKIQGINGKLTPENLKGDIPAGRNAIVGYVDDSGSYVVEIYSYKDDYNAVVSAKLNNGIPDTNYDIQIKDGSRTDINNNIINNGLVLSNGEKLTFNNKYTGMPIETTQDEVAVTNV